MGNDTKPWICDICGAVITDDKQEYCDYCGEKIDRSPRKETHTEGKGALWIILAIAGLILLFTKK